MSFPLNARVRVRTIGKVGRVVAAGRAGRYRVLVGGIEVACREQDLEAAPDATGRKQLQADRRPQSAGAGEPSNADRLRLGTIDLHGATVEEAVRVVEARLDEAIRAGLDHLDIIHGLGTGKVRHAVHQLLRGIGAVRRFEVAPGNPGMTRAYL
jgi:DNA mismatch repair protein MutS2